MGRAKAKAFLYELAALAGSGEKLFIGNFVSTGDFYEAKKHPIYAPTAPAKGPYEACISGFFESFSIQVQQQWPEWKEPVAFFFDQNDDPKWRHDILEAFAASKKKDPRMATLDFVDSKVSPNFPVQAADMLCYRFRQIAEGFLDPDALPDPSHLDYLLIRPILLRATTEYTQGMVDESLSVLPLRYGNFPWRKKV